MKLPSLKVIWKNRVKALAAFTLLLSALVVHLYTRVLKLSVKPEIQSEVKVSKTEAKVKNVKRGPAETFKKKTTTPDGTVIVETTKRLESEETFEDAKGTFDSLEKKSEVPVFAPANKRRYVGIAVNPLNHTRPRVSVGLNFFGRLDLGVYYDSQYKFDKGAFGLETRFRF